MKGMKIKQNSVPFQKDLENRLSIRKHVSREKKHYPILDLVLNVL